jgi:hypothetical protein
MSEACGYEHVQRGWLRALLLAVAVGMAVWAVVVWREDADAAVGLVVVAGVMAVFSYCFATLTVRDAGDRLTVRFGPLALFRTSVRYADITRVEAMRPKYFSWGIHWTPKGWLWNIHGLDCVQVVAGRRKLLVGTDDPAGMAAFLQKRTGKTMEVSR